MASTPPVQRTPAAGGALSLADRPTIPFREFSLRWPPMERVCERCGGADDDLVAVRPADDRSDSWEEPLELWCFSCRSEYPTETAE